MKIGVISDIHNNVLALKAVLQLFSMHQCEMIICAGDLIGIGPSPEETVTILRDLKNFYAIKGNHESYIHDLCEETMGKSEYDHHLWEHNLLSMQSKAYLSSLEINKIIEVAGKRLLITHYPDTSVIGHDFLLDFEAHELDRCFQNSGADVVIFGHTHKALNIKYENRHYINPGSLGCHNYNEMSGSAGILTIEDQISYEQLDVSYDISQVVQQIQSLKYPAYAEILKMFYNVSCEGV